MVQYNFIYQQDSYFEGNMLVYYYSLSTIWQIHHQQYYEGIFESQ